MVVDALGMLVLAVRPAKGQPRAPPELSISERTGNDNFGVARIFWRASLGGEAIELGQLFREMAVHGDVGVGGEHRRQQDFCIKMLGCVE